MTRLMIRFRHLKPMQVILLGFLFVILSGTLLLMLPAASRSGEGASAMDALFTAVSATCVTGLVVRDTATYWSGFGQAVILVLIQIGGLGVITVALAIALISGRRIGLIQRNLMQESISAPTMEGIVKFTRFILIGTFCCEGTGAVILMTVFTKAYGFLKGSWFSVFHAVSAFCNAGFDLMGDRQEYSSLTWYRTNPVINLTIMGLIIVGGIGFLTWKDFYRNGFLIHRYRFQSKVILAVTGILILVPTIYFYLCELSAAPRGARLWMALFQAVTPRTAGFNTADLTSFSETGIFLTIILMLIGGAPASTAGGMKTTTIAVLCSSAFSVFRRKKDAELLDRRVSVECIQNAGAILLLYICLFSFGGLIISRIEGLPLLTCLFETSSAIGTVGLTLGITPGLSLVSRLILIGLMYFGRVGGLTIIFAAVADGRMTKGRLPEEQITVG